MRLAMKIALALHGRRFPTLKAIENGFADIENYPPFNVPEGAFTDFNVYYPAPHGILPILLILSEKQPRTLCVSATLLSLR